MEKSGVICFFRELSLEQCGVMWGFRELFLKKWRYVVIVG